MAGTNFGAPQGDIVQVQLTQEEGLAILAQCVGAPGSVATAAGVFERGCLMIRTDATSGSGLWEMTGTTASPAWTAVGTASPGSISLVNGHVLVGNVNGVAADVAMSGDVTMNNMGIATIQTNAVTNAKLAGSIAGSKLLASAFISPAATGIDASGGAGDVTATGVKSGDALLWAINLTDGSVVTSDFASTANGNDTISQTSANLAGKSLLLMFLSRQ